MGLAADAYARMLAALLPPGRLWRMDGRLAALLLGTSDELARVDGRVADLLDEADPSTATELLPDYERVLELSPASSSPERRGAIVARLVRRQRFRPVDFTIALSQLLALDPADVEVIERGVAYCTAVGDQREIYKFFVYRDPTLDGTYFLTSAQELVDAMAPSHTVGVVIETTAMLYDDAFSLYDRDLMFV